MKRCPRCKEEKPDGHFYKCLKSRSGLSTYCRPCSRLSAAEFKTRLSAPPYKVRPATPPAPVPTLTRPVTPDADFLADLADALADDQTLRGCDSPFERIQINQYGQ